MQVREERLSKHRKNTKTRKERLKSEGLCTDCGKRPLVNNKHCDACREKNNEQSNARKKELKAAGLCTDCGKRPLFTKKLCLVCRDKELAIYAALRKEVLEHYGAPYCSCCWEKFDNCFLVLDHIHGDGYKHREEVKARSLCGWLKKNNFPAGIVQVLCANCNTAKGNNACCIHKQQRKEMLAKQTETITLLEFDNFGG